MKHKRVPDPKLSVEKRLAQQRRYWGGRVQELLETIRDREQELRAIH